MKEELMNVWKNRNTGEFFEMAWGWLPGLGPYELVRTYVKRSKD